MDDDIEIEGGPQLAPNAKCPITAKPVRFRDIVPPPKTANAGGLRGAPMPSTLGLRPAANRMVPRLPRAPRMEGVACTLRECAPINRRQCPA